MESKNKYEDMLDIKWPKESCREKMRLEDRAKIFLPFAALKGFEEEIEKRKNKVINQMNIFYSEIPD